MADQKLALLCSHSSVVQAVHNPIVLVCLLLGSPVLLHLIIPLSFGIVARKEGVSSPRPCRGSRRSLENRENRLGGEGKVPPVGI